MSVLYWIIITVRNVFFDKGVIQQKKFPVVIISVGNITAGGAGKTPMVELLLKQFVSTKRCAVVSRGYKRKSEKTVVVSNGQQILTTVYHAGDEPMQLAQKFPQSVVVVDEIRVRGITTALDYGAELVVLDDAFQHRYVQRDIDIVVIPADDCFRASLVLPAGKWREPKAALQRCTAIFITRCENC